MKKIFISLAIIIILGVSLFLFFKKENKVAVSPEPVKEPISLCYANIKETDHNFYDQFLLRLDLSGDKVTGNFVSSPAEKDLKTGTFAGTVGALDQKTMARTADVWWDASAEGTQVKEELIISFGDGSASVMGGEMVDRGDGVYVYRDKTKLIPSYPQLGQTDCSNFDEIKIVEKYIKDNIKTIATNKPILGGSWYTLYVGVNPGADEALVMYEDGHIQSKAKISYKYDPATQKVTILKFEAKPGE